MYPMTSYNCSRLVKQQWTVAMIIPLLLANTTSVWLPMFCSLLIHNSTHRGLFPTTSTLRAAL